jgi:hypothetical protein
MAVEPPPQSGFFENVAAPVDFHDRLAFDNGFQCDWAS